MKCFVERLSSRFRPAAAALSYNYGDQRPVAPSGCPSHRTPASAARGESVGHNLEDLIVLADVFGGLDPDFSEFQPAGILGQFFF